MMWLLETMLKIYGIKSEKWWETYIKHKKLISVYTLTTLSMIIIKLIELLIRLMGMGLIWLGNERPYILAIVFIVILIGASIIAWRERKAKLEEEKKEEKSSIEKQRIEEHHKNVKECYFKLRITVYEIMQECGKSIECASIRNIRELDMIVGKHQCENDVIFTLFKLPKEDVRANYSDEDLEAFKNIIQSCLTRKIHEVENTDTNFAGIEDEYGNIFEKINIDRVEDWGNYFVMYVVLYSKEYAEYWRNRELNRINLVRTEHKDKDF